VNLYEVLGYVVAGDIYCADCADPTPDDGAILASDESVRTYPTRCTSCTALLFEPTNNIERVCIELTRPTDGWDNSIEVRWEPGRHDAPIYIGYNKTRMVTGKLERIDVVRGVADAVFCKRVQAFGLLADWKFHYSVDGYEDGFLE